MAIAVNSKRLSRIDERNNWFAIAKELIPANIHLITQRAQEAYDRGDHKAAADLLRGIISNPERPGLAWLVFADSLLKLGTSEAAQEACTVLNQVASENFESPRDRRQAAVRLVEAQLDFDRDAAAASIERHRETLGAYRAEKLRLALAHESGRGDEATEIANRMMASREQYTREELLDFGGVLGQLRLNEECVEVLEGVAPRNLLGQPTIALLNAAMASGRLELVANICNALRTAGVDDPQIVDGEAYVLSVRGDLTGALELVQKWLSTHPDDKRIRLRLSQVAYELGRTDLLPTRSDELPEPTDAHPEVAVHVVQILRASNQHAEARRFAYANLKRRRRDEWAWKAISIAGLPSTAAANDADEAERAPIELVAGPGMAVRIKERNSSKWIQLEETDELVTAEDEYGPSHPITLALSGKKVGDQVELQKSRFGLPARTVEIEANASCFTRACQECNESYELQFPQTPFIHSFYVPDSVDDLIAILSAGLKERHESVETLVKAYGENPRISLHGLAKLCDRSIFEVIPFLASTGTVIHAARPSERMKAGRESLQRTREIIVETTAISTLAMLEMLDRVKAHFTKIWIARTTLDRLRAYIHSTISSGASAHMGLEGGRLFLLRRDPSFEAQRAEYLRKLLARVESWDVFHETERELLASTSWDAWTEAAGGGTADSVHRAKRLGLALWSDDVAIAAAAEHEGAAPISTQAVFETLATLDVISRDELADIGSKLVGWRYVDTRTPPESFLAAAKIAKGDPSARPLVQHMELLTMAKWSERDLALVGAEVFRLWWNNTLDRNGVDALVVAALIRLAARSNGERLLKLLLVAVQRRFGLDVLGARHVSEVVVGWMATRYSPR